MTLDPIAGETEIEEAEVAVVVTIRVQVTQIVISLHGNVDPAKARSIWFTIVQQGFVKPVGSGDTISTATPAKIIKYDYQLTLRVPTM